MPDGAIAQRLFSLEQPFFFALAYLQGTLIDLGLADPPYLGSFLFLPLSLMMSYILAGDVVKASHLANEVKMAEARWRNLLENVQLMVVGVDHDKSIFYVNPFFLDATGYLKSEVLNHPLLNILPEPSSSGVVPGTV